MKKSKLKEIFARLRTCIDDLEAEIYSDKESYLRPYVHPWDQHMRVGDSDDDDGYPD
jgi:hypothetical protein|tara:strand:- start:2034 stop:2204 length:171 start_codon:yes stop_codon:yes gene_type:complete